MTAMLFREMGAAQYAGWSRDISVLDLGRTGNVEDSEIVVCQVAEVECGQQDRFENATTEIPTLEMDAIRVVVSSAAGYAREGTRPFLTHACSFPLLSAATGSVLHQKSVTMVINSRAMAVHRNAP